MQHSGSPGQIYMIVEQLLLAKEKKCRSILIIHTLIYIYSDLHTVIVSIVIWKTVMLMFLMGDIVCLLKLLHLWIKFNIHSL